MKIIKNPPRSQWKEICKRPQINADTLEQSVSQILDKVRNEGDKALFELTAQFDKAQLQSLQVSPQEIEKACKEVSDELKKAIGVAAKNIEKFHAAQRQTFTTIETTPGVLCSRRATPVEKVGLYIPGGSAPLFSTILMLGIPAKLAGCKEIILCSPPSLSGALHAAILYTASSIGITKIFKIGGSQAIAAMAFGTETIPQVYKIFGPGNQYVTKAKQLVNQKGIAIDIPAGPSEVLVMADEKANPVFVAADLLSQAEHGVDSQVMLVCTDEKTAEKISWETESQLKELPRKQIAEGAMKNSCALVFDLKEDCIDFVNEYAAEHLIINTHDCDEVVEKITNAGSIFLGQYTPESAGDYASGTNHTLPTGGCARAYSGVSLDSFMKFITIQKISSEGIKNLGPAIATMARGEALHGHAKAIEVRLPTKN